jgi:hypothetical protein
MVTGTKSSLGTFTSVRVRVASRRPILEMPMVSIDIIEAGFEQRTRHLSDDGSIRSRSRARFHLP